MKCAGAGTQTHASKHAPHHTTRIGYMHAHAHTHTHTHTHTHIYVYIYNNTASHTYMHAHCTHTHTHTHAHMQAHTHTHARNHTHTCTHANTYTHARTHAYKHTHTHTHTHVFGQQVRLDWNTVGCSCRATGLSTGLSTPTSLGPFSQFNTIVLTEWSTACCQCQPLFPESSVCVQHAILDWSTAFHFQWAESVWQAGLDWSTAVSVST